MRRFGSAVRSDLGWPRLTLGLWFPSSLAQDLSRDADGGQARLQSVLTPPQLGAFTCNAFPYGFFHDPVVKTKVYHPDWTRPERLAYTLACARLLATLLPEGGVGSVSTLPLGWRAGWTPDHARSAASALCDYVAGARELADKKNRTLRLGLEPEPGCALETIDQVVAFWDEVLRPTARARGLADADLNAFVGLCYDTCHQAVQFEDPIRALDKLAAAGIPIVKMQLSSALEFQPDPDRVTRALRQSFVEPRFLHQTRVWVPQDENLHRRLPHPNQPSAKAARAASPPSTASAGYSLHSSVGGKTLGFDDLPEALEIDNQDLWSQPWRVHYHVPIHADAPVGFSTTQADMIAALRHALKHDLCRHFEVETYTWSVLPEALRPKDDAALAHCLAEEIRFVINQVPEGTFSDA